MAIQEDTNKAKTFIIVDTFEYVPNSVVKTNIIKKSTGNVSVISFDSGETLEWQISPYDTFILVIEGIALVEIDHHSNILETGKSIIIPAHSISTIKAKARFKMISTVIKSWYDTVN